MDNKKVLFLYFFFGGDRAKRHGGSWFPNQGSTMPPELGVQSLNHGSPGKSLSTIFIKLRRIKLTRVLYPESTLPQVKMSAKT